VSAIATESRSQARNRTAALRRLRVRLALEIREAWNNQKVSLKISRRSEEYPKTIGLVLDALCESGWSVSGAAKLLATTTGQISRFINGDEKVLAEVNRQREQAGLKKLG
jgi:hypothetical protein